MFFQQGTIRQKLSVVVVSASFIVLLLLGALVGTVEYMSIRQSLSAEQQTLASILGSQLASSLMDRDLLTAKKILSSLDKDRRVLAAYLFDLEYIPIAQYLDVRSTRFVSNVLKKNFNGRIPSEWRNAQEPKKHFGLNHLALFYPVFHQDVQIGSIYLLSDLSDFNQKLMGLLVSMLLVGGFGIGLAWALSGRLSRPIAEPLLELTRTMHSISTNSDYRLRVEKLSGDEIGQLVDGFNDMLTQIEVRDSRIENHQRHLEGTVRERTAQLSETVLELAEAKRQSDTANQAKSVFLANVTHELRTPLIGVLGMNELLMESGLDPQQKALAETVQNSGNELLGLINEILDFSKLEGGGLELREEPVNLLELVERVLCAHADKAFNKELALTCRIEPDAAWQVEADPQRLSQVLQHLLDNAIKFTERGYVELRLALLDSGETLFEVRDSGIGIDEQSQAEIFEAFLQVDSSTARHFGGAGLGLSVVQRLTTLMRGRVGLESRRGEGACFSVALPLKRLESRFVVLPVAQRERAVVVFCPDDRTRESQVQLLLDLGFSAVGVADSAGLLQRLQNADLHANRFDMVFVSESSAEGLDPDLFRKIQVYCRLVVCLWRASALPPDNDKLVNWRLPLCWSQMQDARLYHARPRAVPAPVVKRTEPTERSCCGGDNSLLVVDDNASTRELIALSLGGSVWKPEEASSAAEALAAVERRQFSLILMDINMPGMDGLETVRQMRERGVSSPIYALTAHGDEELFDECREVGMQGVLRKPFRQRELFDLLEQISGRSEQSGSLGAEVG